MVWTSCSEKCNIQSNLEPQLKDFLFLFLQRILRGVAHSECSCANGDSHSSKSWSLQNPLVALWVHTMFYSSKNLVCMAAWIRRQLLSVSSPDSPLWPRIQDVPSWDTLWILCRAATVLPFPPRHWQGATGSFRFSVVTDGRMQACPLHSPEGQLNRMNTSAMIEGQRQECTENWLTADPKKIPAAVWAITIDRKVYSLVQVLLFACSGHCYFHVIVLVIEMVCSVSPKCSTSFPSFFEARLCFKIKDKHAKPSTGLYIYLKTANFKLHS